MEERNLSPQSDLAGTRRERWSWAMYDWANSAYSTLSIVVLVTYIRNVALPGTPGTLLWGWGLGLTMMVAALLSPVLGAMADARGNKRHWLIGTTLLGATASSLMFFATPDRPWLLVTLFLLSNIGMELSQGFYNAFLPDIANDEEMGRVSARGFALGYLGGGLALLLAIGVLTAGDKLGIPDDLELRLRLCLAGMGIWWGVFSLPAMLWLRDSRPPLAPEQSGVQIARSAVAQVGRTLRSIRRYKMLALFLLGFLIYNDGVQTVISQASVFATDVVDMEAAELAMVVLMIQFVALPGALLVGQLADRMGHKPTLMLCLAVWIVLLALAFFITTKGQFWAMAAVAALVLGGTQSVSRAMMGLMTPPAHSAEFFGFFNLTGKATSMFGPILFTSILTATGSPHWALVSLLIFFIVGAALIIPLNVAAGQKQART